MRLPLSLFLILAVAACGQKQAAKRMEEKLKAEEARKAEQKKKDEEADAKRFQPAPEEKITLPSPYNDSDATLLSDEGPCPDGMWALFKGDVPGATKEEKKANEAKRAELVKALKEKTFMVKLRPPAVDLKPFDAPKGEFPLEIAGSIECQDSIGHVSIAWTPAKAGDPGNSAAKQDAEVTQNYWMADKVKFSIPFKTMNEAKEWQKTTALGMKARVVFKLGKTAIDHKIKRIAKVTEKAQGETISIGGGAEDWGAGRMVHAELVGLRVATNKEKDQLFEKKGDSK